MKTRAFSRPSGGINDVEDCAVRDQDFELHRGIISLTFSTGSNTTGFDIVQTALQCSFQFDIVDVVIRREKFRSDECLVTRI